jgi:DNA-binding NarL/FixJ family response regulator
MDVFVFDPYPLTRQAICALIDRTPDLQLRGAAGDLKQALSGLSENPVGLVVVEPLAARGREGELLAALADAAPKAKLLALSARAEKGFVERLLTAGASGFVYKGESAETTMLAIRDVLQGRKVVIGAFWDCGDRPGSQRS